MNFKELGLIEPIVRAIAAEGYAEPTPIQAQAIGPALDGRDVLGCAQTGTGKTCAFALPILQRISNSDGGPRATRGGRKGRAPRAIVLCPTRELATQIHDSFVTYGRQLPLRHAVVFGGVSQHHQVRALQAGIDVLIATPGRLLDLIGQGYIDLSAIEVLVLDEADRMLDMGFINDIRKVVKLVPAKRQTLLFSATVSADIRRLADSMLRDPVRVETTPESSTVETVAQRVHMVEKANKPRLLQHVLETDSVGRTLVFTRTKYGADKLTRFLNRAKIHAQAIHSNKSQNQRTRALSAFRSGKTWVLVATDVASRGIDVDDITHVVNFDMPADAETYVHRVGRTARAGASGVAISFCDREQRPLLRDIEDRIRVRIPVADAVAGLSVSVAHEPAESPRDASTQPGQRRRSKPRARGARRSGSPAGQSRNGMTAHGGSGGSGRRRNRTRGGKSGLRRGRGVARGR